MSYRGNSPEEMRSRLATQVLLQLLHLDERLMSAGCPVTGSPYHICCICMCSRTVSCSQPTPSSSQCFDKFWLSTSATCHTFGPPVAYRLFG